MKPITKSKKFLKRHMRQYRLEMKYRQAKHERWKELFNILDEKIPEAISVPRSLIFGD